MTFFSNSGTPSISRERFKVQTSNLAYRLTTRGSYEKNMKIRSNGMVKGSRGLLFEFWDPLHMLGTVQLETSNLVHTLTTRVPTKENKNNVKGVVKGSRDLLFVFWDALHI